MRKLSRIMSVSSLMLILMLSLSACVAPTPEANACSWLREDLPAAGFEARWTHDEKAYAIWLNKNIEKDCPHRGEPF